MNGSVPEALQGNDFGADSNLKSYPKSVDQSENMRESQQLLELAKLLDKPDAFAGRKIHVRGKVIKVNDGIMGRNWIHLVDKSLEGKQNDLTVTTQASLKKRARL